MPQSEARNVMLLDGALAIVAAPIGLASYDFDFGLHFVCTHPYRFEPGTRAVLRVGAVDDYPALHAEVADWGLAAINSPEQHVLASELEAWYPLIADLTPRTRLYDELPSAAEIEREFAWPVFIKGSRQTSRHDPELSIARDREHYEQLAVRYRNDRILRWQKAAVREFVPLVPVEGGVARKIRPSVEFRSFWWHGTCVGVGRYWFQVPDYEAADLDDGLALAAAAAARLGVPFLVVDFAKAVDGRWVVIECNDAQEAGHAAIAPHMLWRAVLDLES